MLEVDVAYDRVLEVPLIRNTGKLGLLDYLIFVYVVTYWIFFYTYVGPLWWNLFLDMEHFPLFKRPYFKILMV